jgi:putative tryptophan/tyrosine transport system substrate-binding protein
VGADDATGERVAAKTDHPPSLAKRSLRRHTPEVGAVCGKAARTVLCGGRVMKHASLPLQRRDFIAGLGGAAAWPIVARGQQPERVRRVGALFGGAASEHEQLWFGAFVRRLDELGWKQDRTLWVELRWGKGSREQLRASAAELLAWNPDVILAFNNLALAELKPLAGTVPIVFAGVGDPVASGFVTSLARPGANITGFESFAPTMGGKWLEVLKQTVPSLTRVLALMHPETAVHQEFWSSMRDSAATLGIDVTSAGVHDASEITDAITSFATNPNGGVVSFPHAVTNAHSELIVALELRYHLPGLYAGSVDGSLVSYGLDWPNEMRRAAEYVDRILRGSSPAELPVQAPIRFVLVLNLKAAKAIGLEIPSSVLLRADEVIE